MKKLIYSISAIVMASLLAWPVFAMPPDGLPKGVSGDGASGLTVDGSVAIGNSLRLGQYTVATLPTSPTTGDRVEITDGDDATDCTTGGGTDIVTCRWSGAAWVNAGDGTAAGSAEVVDAAVGDAGDTDTTHAYSKDDIRDYVYIGDPDFDGKPSVLDETVTGPTSIAVGVNPASAGTVRIKNNSGVFGRNAGNDGNINLIDVDSSDIVNIGDANAAQVIVATDSTGTNEVVLPAGSIDSTEILDGTIAIGDIAAATLVIESEGISSNDNDTTVPTSAAVVDYVGSVGGSGDVTAVGNCTTGDCLDGTDDGGTQILFYDAQGATTLVGGDTAGAVTVTLPAETGTLITSTTTTAFVPTGQVDLRSASEVLMGPINVADDIAIIIGDDSDWTLTYDETTSDALEFTHAAGPGADVTFDLNDGDADSLYTITNGDGSNEANLSVEGDGTFGGDVSATGSVSGKAKVVPDTSGGITLTVNAVNYGTDSGDADIPDGACDAAGDVGNWVVLISSVADAYSLTSNDASNQFIIAANVAALTAGDELDVDGTMVSVMCIAAELWKVTGYMGAIPTDGGEAD